MIADAVPSLRASTLARVPRETVTALTLGPALHGGPEVAILIDETPVLGCAIQLVNTLC